MSIFFENDPTLQSYWRSIILYGRNVASYKFALGKALIDLNKKPNDLIKLEDLSEPFSNHLCEHLKQSDKQITSSNSKFLNSLKKFNKGEIKFEERISEYIKPSPSDLGIPNSESMKPYISEMKFKQLK